MNVMACTSPKCEQSRQGVQRAQWSHTLIAEGERLLEEALSRGRPGPYQIQAAIAALHDRAASNDATDWVQIRSLYELLLRINDSPMARLSHAIAIAMIEGPTAELNAIDDLSVDPRISTHHRLDAVRAHLRERAGRLKEAVRYFRQAAERTASTPERNYLLLHAARLNESVSNADSPHS